MSIRASNKRWIAALSAALMVCVCASASAQNYSLGDEADEVATIQTALKQLKLYSAGITGHYGEKTEAAVKKFQKKYAFEDNGIVDEDTRAALYEAAGITYTASGSSSSSSSSASSSSSSSVSGSAILRYGTRSDEVIKLQQNLTKLGLYTGTISGHYGSITEAAVMNFQRKNGLSADGIAGAKTLAKIEEKVNGSSSSSSSGSSSSSSSSSGNAAANSSNGLLKYGVRSDAVRTLQQNLKTLGYYDGSVTGNFGRLTKEAVYNFQKANGLSADGVAGAKTLSSISGKLSGNSSSGNSSSSGSGNSNSNSSGSSSSNNSSDSSTLLNTSVMLQQGSSSSEVLKLQNMLASLGFYTGNKTGNFGALTADAVMAYQKSKGLTADGIAGKKTLAAINADYSGKGSTSAGTTNGTTAPSTQTAGNVIYENFYNWRRNYANGEYCTVYDFSTGYSWKLRIMTKDAHMDAEPATAEDTVIMLKAFGGKTTWTPKAVWVTFSDGKTYIGSTHDVPHSPQHLSNNNFNGHLCVHFPISMEKAQSIGPYATSHQEAINEGWAATQKLKY